MIYNTIVNIKGKNDNGNLSLIFGRKSDFRTMVVSGNINWTSCDSKG